MSSFQGIPTWVYFLAGAFLTALIKEIPYWVKGLDKLPPFLMRCMNVLPIAAIGALVFPGAVTDFGPRWYAGIAGVVVAFLIGLGKKPMIVSIVASILVCYLLLIV